MDTQFERGRQCRYLFTLPKGGLFYFTIAGALLLSLIVLCLVGDKASVGFFLILFGDLLIDQLFGSLGIPSFGFIVATSLGLILIFLAHKNSGFRSRNSWPPMIWLLLVSIVLIVSYGLGPQTDYSDWKLLHYHTALIINGVAFMCLLSNQRCDLWEIGTLLIVAATMAYASDIYFNPSIAPDNIFSPAGTRINVNTPRLAEEVHYFKRTGLLASMGAIYMLCAVGSMTITVKRALILT